MQIVINIPEEEYEDIIYSEDCGLHRLTRAIANGIPLPKGHGRLIDADALVKKMEEREEKLKDDRSMWETAGVETALDMFAPTIIETDKAESEQGMNCEDCVYSDIAYWEQSEKIGKAKAIYWCERHKELCDDIQECQFEDDRESEV